MARWDRTDLEDLVEGAGLLGSGGGGTLAAGRMLVDTILGLCPEGLDVLVDPTTLDDEALLVVAADVGASDHFVPDQDVATTNAVRALVEAIRPGGAAAAIVPGEVGPESSLAAAVVAAHLGVPVVDVDGAGRALPTLPLSCFDAGGISASPCAIAGTGPERAVLQAADASGIEALMRPLLSLPAFDDSAGMALWAMTPAQAGRFGIAGTLTRARDVGRALRLARERRSDAVAAVLGVTGLRGRVIVRGRATRTSSADSGGFTSDVIEVAPQDGPAVLVIGQNENLLAWPRDATSPEVTAPDLLCWITPDGHGTTSAEVVGDEPVDGVTLLALHAEPRLWEPELRGRFAEVLAGLGYPGPPVPLTS